MYRSLNSIWCLLLMLFASPGGLHAKTQHSATAAEINLLIIQATETAYSVDRSNDQRQILEFTKLTEELTELRSRNSALTAKNAGLDARISGFIDRLAEKDQQYKLVVSGIRLAASQSLNTPEWRNARELFGSDAPQALMEMESLANESLRVLKIRAAASFREIAYLSYLERSRGISYDQVVRRLETLIAIDETAEDQYLLSHVLYEMQQFNASQRSINRAAGLLEPGDPNQRPVLIFASRVALEAGDEVTYRMNLAKAGAALRDHPDPEAQNLFDATELRGEVRYGELQNAARLGAHLLSRLGTSTDADLYCDVVDNFVTASLDSRAVDPPLLEDHVKGCLTYRTQAYSRIPSLLNRYNMALSESDLGEVYYQIGDLQNSEAMLKNAYTALMDLSESVPPARSALPRTTMVLSRAHSQLSGSDSIELVTMAVSKLNGFRTDANETDSTELARLLLHLGYLYGSQGKITERNAAFQEAARVVKNVAPKRGNYRDLIDVKVAQARASDQSDVLLRELESALAIRAEFMPQGPKEFADIGINLAYGELPVGTQGRLAQLRQALDVLKSMKARREDVEFIEDFVDKIESEIELEEVALRAQPKS